MLRVILIRFILGDRHFPKRDKPIEQISAEVSIARILNDEVIKSFLAASEVIIFRLGRNFDTTYKLYFLI